MIYGDNNTGIPSMQAIMQSSNLYVYCLNDSINFVDKAGYWVMTVSAGAQVQCGIGVKGDVGLAMDGQGNIASISSIGIGGGTPSLAGGMTFTFYFNANHVKDIEGVGLETGGSGTAAYANVGVDYVQGSGNVHGISITVGTDLAGIFTGVGITAEGHAYLSYTKVGEPVNANTMMSDWLIQLNGILPDDIKRELNEKVFGYTVFIPGSNASNRDDYMKDYYGGNSYQDFYI